MVGRTVSVISPFYSLLPGYSSFIAFHNFNGLIATFYLRMSFGGEVLSTKILESVLNTRDILIYARQVMNKKICIEIYLTLQPNVVDHLYLQNMNYVRSI